MSEHTDDDGFKRDIASALGFIRGDAVSADEVTESIEIPAAPCRFCGKEIDRASGNNSAVTPGALVLCVYCGEISVSVKSGESIALRPPSIDDWVWINENFPQLKRQMAQVRVAYLARGQ